MTVRVRFAPSPTGKLHVGSVRTVVFNWLFARKMGGQFILRIEDTDRTRYHPDSLASIFDGLRWLGLDWDEGPALEELQRVGLKDAGRYAVGGAYGPYIQSNRLQLYRQVAEELLANGWAYRCNCTPERLAQVRAEQRARKETPMYDRHCRDLPPGAISPDEPHVVRLKVPLTGQTVVHDVVRGDAVFENAQIDDQVLLKSDGFPTYHLAVVVDDHLMEITHIIRADEWFPSTPKHVLLYQALGWETPVYCHVPLVLGADGKKTLQAPRGHLCRRVPRPGLSAGGAPQLPGVAGLGAGGRGGAGDIQPRGVDRAFRPVSRQPCPGHLFLRQTRLDERCLYPQPVGGDAAGAPAALLAAGGSGA